MHGHIQRSSMVLTNDIPCPSPVIAKHVGRYLYITKSCYSGTSTYSSCVLYNKVLDITNHFLYPSYGKIYEKEPRYNEASL